MKLEIEILKHLISSYERSKISKGLNKVNRSIKIDITNPVFDNYRNSKHDELEIVIERIKRMQFAQPIYTKDGQFQSLFLNLDETTIDKLYKHLNRINPKNLIQNYCLIFKKHLNESQIVNDFCSKMITLLNEHKLSSVNQYISCDKDIDDICLAINKMSDLDEDIPERIFCAKLFSDSKRFIELRGKISKIIKEFSPESFDEDDDTIARMGVIKNTSYAFIKGSLTIKLNNQIIDLKEYGYPLALNDAAIKNLEIVRMNAKYLYTIENLTSFDIFDKEDSIVIYLGGFHNKIKRKLIEKINLFNPNIHYYHYGDIDAGGFYILNHLRNKTNINFIPYMMSIKQLETYKNSCRPLTANDKCRLQKMLDDNSFIEFKNTIEFMLKNNIKLEQEAEN